MSDATLGYLTPGANSAGGYLAGALPHRAAAGKGAAFGLNAQSMWDEKLAGYLLQAVEPEFDCAHPGVAISALNNAEFVVSLSAYKSDSLLACADVLLPVAPFTETSGTFVNVEGDWQSFQGAVRPRGETRPAWKVLRVLGNLFHLDGFEYDSSDELRDELKGLIGGQPEKQSDWYCPKVLTAAPAGLVRVADVAAYASDAITRRASSLQQTTQSGIAIARISAPLAASLGLSDADKVEVKQGGVCCIVALQVDERAADDTVWLPSGFPETSGFGVNGAEVSLRPVL